MQRVPFTAYSRCRRVRKGKVITQTRIQGVLAKASRADCASPLTTGMFIRIAAETPEDDHRAGKRRITPFWRTIRDDGGLDETVT